MWLKHYFTFQATFLVLFEFFFFQNTLSMLSLSYSGALDLQEQLYFSQFDGNCRYGQSLLKDLLRKISRNL